MDLKFSMPSLLIRTGGFGHRNEGVQGRRPYEDRGREQSDASTS